MSTRRLGLLTAAAISSLLPLFFASLAVAAPEDVLGLLLDPLTPIGVPNTPVVNQYDRDQLTLGRQHAERFPQYPNNLAQSNYYDFAYSLYQIYDRTGDPYWQGKARHVAQVWRDGVRQTLSNRPPPREMSTLGLAVLAAEMGDAKARQIVDLHARDVETYWMSYWDPRENGYALMALVASSMLGDDHRASAAQQLNTILAQQRADGSFVLPPRGMDPSVCGGNYVNSENFMLGILLEALVLYDRAIGDARILPALRRSMSWLWTTQWVPSARAFRYAPEACLGTAPALDLNGLFLPAWGYARAKTGNITYKTQGDAIFQGLVNGACPECSVKHFSQAFRSSARYLGWITP